MRKKTKKKLLSFYEEYVYQAPLAKNDHFLNKKSNPIFLKLEGE
jgi:hypothetical protein